MRQASDNIASLLVALIFLKTLTALRSRKDGYSHPYFRAIL
jgi:hypothetical protein